MAFPQTVVDEVLIKCGRRCSICGKFCGTNIELHHIIPVSEGGKDTFDNCIPLCYECHANVGHYNPNHPKGRKFSIVELKGHRDKCYAMYSGSELKKPQNIDGEFLEKLFDNIESDNVPMWGYPGQDYASPITKGNVIMVAGKSDSMVTAYIDHIVNWNIRQKQKIVYFSTVQNSEEIMYDIIAESVNINKIKLKKGNLTADDWKLISLGLSGFDKESLKIFSASETNINYNDIISTIEKAGANIIVIDDLNGLLIDKSFKEEFMYKLKWAAGKSGAVVFVVYNMTIPEMRMDQRPMIHDFSNECYYRLSDIVHFLYRVSDDYLEEHLIEIIIIKGAERVYTIKMATPPNLNKILVYDRDDKDT